MFTKWGDVSVVKIGSGLYWVEFESLDTEKPKPIDKVAQFFKKKEPKLIKDIKLYDDAIRFGQN